MTKELPDSPPFTDVYIHVPKTAGTTLRSLVVARYGVDRTTVLHGRTGLLSPAREAEEYGRPNPHDVSRLYGLATRALYSLPAPAHTAALRIRNKLSAERSQEKLRASSAAVLGHFTVDRLADCLGEGPPLRVFTVVREPLQRMLSHYNYGVQLHQSGQPLVGWMENHDFSLPFEDFALSKGLKNFQTSFTGTNPELYDSIGLTEDLGSFLGRLGLVGSREDIPRFNETHAQLATNRSLSDNFVAEFEACHAADYAFYAAVQTTR